MWTFWDCFVSLFIVTSNPTAHVCWHIEYWTVHITMTVTAWQPSWLHNHFQSHVLYALMVYLYARMMCACVYALTACFQVCCTCLTASASCSSCEGDTHLQCVVCDSGNWCFSPSHCMTDCVDALFYRQWTMRSWRRWKRHLEKTRHFKRWHSLMMLMWLYPRSSVVTLWLVLDEVNLCQKCTSPLHPSPGSVPLMVGWCMSVTCCVTQLDVVYSM